MYKFRYGYWRTYVMTVIYKYLDCGDFYYPACGFWLNNTFPNIGYQQFCNNDNGKNGEQDY